MNKTIAVAGLALLALFVASSVVEAKVKIVRRPPGSVIALNRTYLGCTINGSHYLSIVNTTAATIALGTPVYWSGKQEGQPQAGQYSAPVYAAIPPNGSYQIGGAYKYDPSIACQAWMTRKLTAAPSP
jgi:hypothetical protein